MSNECKRKNMETFSAIDLFFRVITCIVRRGLQNVEFFVQESEKRYMLAVETAGRIGSVAIGQADTVLYDSSFSGFMRHSAELFDTLDMLVGKVGIRPGQISEVSITVGPGSFTGIRIAVTLAKMLSYALGARIVAVDTLDALLENAAGYCDKTGSDLQRLAAVLDAKQGRFFTAIYQRNGHTWEKIHPTTLVYPQQVLEIIHQDTIPTGLLGEGLVYYADRFASPLTTVMDKSCWTASARHVYTVGQKMARMGQFSDMYSLVPAYVRKPDAVEKREQK